MPHLLQVRNAARDNVDAQRNSVLLTEDRFRTELASKLDVTQVRSLRLSRQRFPPSRLVCVGSRR